MLNNAKYVYCGFIAAAANVILGLSEAKGFRKSSNYLPEQSNGQVILSHSLVGGYCLHCILGIYMLYSIDMGYYIMLWSLPTNRYL